MKTVGIGWEGSSARRIEPGPDEPGDAWDKAVRLASEVRPRLRPGQRDVYALFLEHGPMTDPEVIRRARARYITQSESGMRTRRKELMRKGLIVDSGERRRTPSNRSQKVWTVV